jgi:hypothetical protein
MYEFVGSKSAKLVVQRRREISSPDSSVYCFSILLALLVCRNTINPHTELPVCCFPQYFTFPHARKVISGKCRQITTDTDGKSRQITEDTAGKSRPVAADTAGKSRPVPTDTGHCDHLYVGRVSDC